SSATSILLNNKDQYMLNQCDGEKFVVVELCDEIKVDTIMLANFEFFSSMFRDFRVYASDRYPPKQGGWTLIAARRARNVRDQQ
ncbi:SUN domain-containing protein, partial [Blyttiomyces helicus]